MKQAGKAKKEKKESQKLTPKVQLDQEVRRGMPVSHGVREHEKMQPSGCPTRSQKRGDLGRPQEVPSGVPEAAVVAQTPKGPENPPHGGQGLGSPQKNPKKNGAHCPHCGHVLKAAGPKKEEYAVKPEVVYEILKN